MNGKMLTCKELVEFLWRYLDDELTPSERIEFDRHLAGCPHCVAYLETYRTTIALGHLAFSDAAGPDGPDRDGVPPEVPEELVQGILAARRSGG